MCGSALFLTLPKMRSACQLLCYDSAKGVTLVTNRREQWNKCNHCWNCTLQKKNNFTEGGKGVTIEQSEGSKVKTLENTRADSWEMSCSVIIFGACLHHKGATRFKSDILAARSNNDKALSPSVTGISIYCRGKSAPRTWTCKCNIVMENLNLLCEPRWVRESQVLGVLLNFQSTFIYFFFPHK